VSNEIATRTSARRLECMEIWGGNQAADSAVAVSGIDAWVMSEPVGGVTSGGDIHFVSTCGGGKIARFAVADVAGHGLSASNVAVKLRRLMRKHINRLDQTQFARDLNREFAPFSQEGTFATALLASYFAPTDHLIVCNAGHPPPLWYRSSVETWQQLEHTIPDRLAEAVNLPLGIIDPTDYYQFAVRLQKGDLVLIYSDGLVEARDRNGKLLDNQGFLNLVRRVDTAYPEAVCRSVLDVVSAYREDVPAQDDLTLVVLHHNGGRPPRQSMGQMVRTMGKMFGLVKA
jgi:sigma-B regulation protein RsbU (phosphoserine phosphatase)